MEELLAIELIESYVYKITVQVVSAPDIVDATKLIDVLEYAENHIQKLLEYATWTKKVKDSEQTLIQNQSILSGLRDSIVRDVRNA